MKEAAQDLGWCAQPVPASNSQQRCEVDIRSQLVPPTQLNVTIQWVPDPDGSPVAGVPGGLLKITPTSAFDLKKPDKIIRDLSTHVDYTSAYVALMCFGLYLLGGFAFYQVRALSESSRDTQTPCVVTASMRPCVYG